MLIPSFRVEVWPLHAFHTPDEQADAERYATGRLYFLRGRALDQQSVERLCRVLLSDPVTEQFKVLSAESLASPTKDSALSTQHFVEVTLLPGVTDSVAENLLRAAKLLGIDS